MDVNNTLPKYRSIKQQYVHHFLTFSGVYYNELFLNCTYKNILVDSLVYAQEHKNITLYAYIILPTCMHIVVKSNEGKLSDFVRDFKRHTANAIYNLVQTEMDNRSAYFVKRRFDIAGENFKPNEKFKVWHPGNNPIPLLTYSDFWEAINYIHLCPVQQGIVAKGSNFIYSSASNYTTNTGKIVVKIPDMELFKNIKGFKEDFGKW